MQTIEKFLKGISPRQYQIEIFETCKKKNCLAVLPTGIGKTLIALMLAIHRMTLFPEEKVIFLAPTRPLAQQHLDYFKKHLPELFAEMQLFTGKVNAEKRKKFWQNSDIIFSTPQCIANDIKKGLYNLKNVSLLIEDEAHRCIKNYSYRYIAQTYIKQAKNPRILGLTASPGSEKLKIKDICKNLSIEEVELRTRQSKDVKKYLQELKFQPIKIPFPSKFEEIRQLLLEIYNKKIEELKSRKLLYRPATKTNLLELQGKIMKSILSGNKHYNILKGASLCAQAIKLQHTIELLETQTLSGFYKYLKELYDQASKAKSKGVQQLVKAPQFNQAYIKAQELIQKNTEHPKIHELKKLIKKELQKNSKSKIIIFTQFRETAVKICKELNQIQGVLAGVFVGQAKKTSAGESTGLSQKEQQEMIKQFSLGEINCLVATSIGEEGLDIPEVHAVIFYEPVPSAIRKIQRAGRTARLLPGKLIILITENTRDVAYYWAAFSREKKMYRAIDSIKEELNNQNNYNKNKENKTEKQKKLF